MIAVFKREFKNFFQNVIGWVFVAAIVFIAALYFKAYNIDYGLSDILYVLVRLLMIMVFSIPVLSMRILTEDRKLRIDQLTLTSPVSVWKVILGKYLSMVSVLGITVIIIGMFPILLSRYTEVDWGTNLLSIFGFFLYGSACIAICMFVSSFTESQVIAAIISIVTMFAVYLMAGIRLLFDDAGNSLFSFISRCLGAFDLSEKYDIFLAGIMDIRVIVYFLSIIFVFIFLTIQSVQKRRYTISVKNFSLSAFSIVGIIVVIALTVLVNIGLEKIPDKYVQSDLTEKKFYSLCDATKGVIEDVSEPVTIYVYASIESKDEMVDRLLGIYADLSDNINIEYIDPNTSNKFYEQYTDTQPEYNSLFVVSDSRTKIVDYTSMYINDYSVNEDGSYDTTRSYDIEGRITAALNYINNGQSAKVYALTGHNEPELDASFISAIEKQNLTYESVMLLGSDIPQDCQLLIINGPQDDISSDDATKLMNYIDKGGKLLIIIPFSDSVEYTNFNKVLEYYNVKTGLGVVVDTKQYDGAPSILIPDVVSNIVTTNVAGKKAVISPNSKSVSVIDESNEDCHLIPWLTTSDSSFRMNLPIQEVTDFTFVQGRDEMGPLSVAATASKTLPNGKTSMAYIVGSVYFFTDSANNITANANLAIFNNIISESVKENADTVVVPVKTTNAEKFVISNSSGLVIFYIIFIVLPSVLLIAGFVIWMKRRKQ